MRPPIIVLLCALALAIILVASRRGKLALRVFGLGIGLLLLARAVAEPFVIDVTDPSTYHNDWGGPHLAGVLAVHCGPGILFLAVVGWLIRRRVVGARTARTPMARQGSGSAVG
jgi:hypothetical protein